MSIQSEISRVIEDRNTIRNKLHSFEVATTTDNLDVLAQKLDAIENRGTPDAEVKEGESYTIEAGYYKGGTVRGVAGGGHYNLQTKTGIIPTTGKQNIAPDSGYYGLSSVSIEPIPDNFKDISTVTATAPDVLANKVIVTSAGQIAGTMPNNGKVAATISVASPSYTVPAGYHNGQGIVSLVTEEKSVTPSEEEQDITPTTGKVLSKVTVEAIPSNYGDATDADAVASNIISGKKAVVNVNGTATLITGSMVNNGAISETIDGLTTTSYTIPAGYTSGGTVSLTDDIETQLASI